MRWSTSAWRRSTTNRPAAVRPTTRREASGAWKGPRSGAPAIVGRASAPAGRVEPGLGAGAVGFAPALHQALARIEPALGQAVGCVPGGDARLDGEVLGGFHRGRVVEAADGQ